MPYGNMSGAPVVQSVGVYQQGDSYVNIRVSRGLGVACVAAAVAGVAWMTTDVLAQANPVYQERIQTMRTMGGSFRPIVGIVQGQSTDLDAAATSARALADAAKRIVAQYPAGTGRDANPETRARPEIWSNRAAFEAAANLLAAEAEKMAVAAATKNADAIRAQMGPLGQACGGCHGGPAASGGTFRFERPS